MCPLCRSYRRESQKYRRFSKSNLNFVNKKLIRNKLYKNKGKVIKEVITLIDSIEPGLDIQVVE